MINASLRSCSSSAASQSLMNSWCMHDVNVSPPYWYILAVMPSGPGAWLGFSFSVRMNVPSLLRCCDVLCFDGPYMTLITS